MHVDSMLSDRDMSERALSIEAARCRARVAHHLSVGDHEQAIRDAERLEEIERRRIRVMRNARASRSSI